MSGDRTILSCKGIHKTYGRSLILRDVSLELHEGELAAVLGQSGSGKTTLFNILAGLDQEVEGRVERMERVGYMLQKDLLMPWKRLIDNIALPLVLEGQSRQEARREAEFYLPAFGLQGLGHRYPGRLSGGQRRRAAFLRTYLYSRHLMLLDEPFTGLDAITRGQLYDWLLDQKERLGLSILLITHDIEEALVLADRIYVLSQGPPSSLWPPLEGLKGEGQQAGTLRHEIRRRLFSDDVRVTYL